MPVSLFGASPDEPTGLDHACSVCKEAWSGEGPQGDGAFGAGGQCSIPTGQDSDGNCAGYRLWMRHISNLCEVTADEVCMETQGWKSFPMVSAITRMLERFRMMHCVELANAQRILRQKVWNRKWFGVVHLDLDSSAKSAYGHEQGVGRGNNTERSHKPMFNPLFACIAQIAECLNC